VSHVILQNGQITSIWSAKNVAIRFCDIFHFVIWFFILVVPTISGKIGGYLSGIISPPQYLSQEIIFLCVLTVKGGGKRGLLKEISNKAVDNIVRMIFATSKSLRDQKSDICLEEKHHE